MRGLQIAHRFGDFRGAARIVEQLAWLAADNGSYLWAAELSGISAGARGRLGASPLLDVAPPARLHDRYLQRIQDNLGASEYESACERGAGYEDGIAQALHRGADTPRPHSGRAAADTPLTGRELQVARLVADGLTNSEVADRLGMAQRTAETHVGRILRKLQLTSRTQLTRWLPASDPDECPPPRT
ncbi:helix-turn-helix transcriptional regulator [Lentzea sp. NPDC054927]